MKRLAVFGAFTVLALGVNASWHRAHSAPWFHAENGLVTLKDGQVIEGLLSGDRIVVPENATVLVADDLIVRASDSIRIAGTLQARDRGERGVADAPHIQLSAGRSIEVHGKVLGGKGRSWPQGDLFAGLTGGKGTDIVMDCRFTLVDGLVVAGDGGVGGRGARSGAGGDVLFPQGAVSNYPGTGAQAGNGAPGGSSDPNAETGAAGGDGGSVICWNMGPEGARVSTAIELLEPRIQLASLIPWQAGKLSTAPAGGPGLNGSDSEGDPGGDGKDGANGTMASPAGAPGNQGMKGMAATGGNGGAGGPGASNCNPAGPGQSGGDGGKGGNATGGKGGTGGMGGDGWTDPTTGAIAAPGGRGGRGGVGGHATGGHGGDGGDGGNGMSPGSAGKGGAKGNSEPGPGGDGGLGGHGVGGAQGSSGSSGPAGGFTRGVAGNDGEKGSEC